MEDSSVAIICCDHGLGHIRRGLLWAKELERKNNQITLLAPKNLTSKIKRAIPSVKDISCIDFATNTYPTLFCKKLNEIIDWLDRLPNLNRYDYVVCDNLPEILLIRKDARLYSQFFWHLVIPDASKEYIDFCNLLLSQEWPVVYGYELFTLPSIKRQRNYRPTSILFSPELVEQKRISNRNTRDCLLVSGGSTSILKSSLKSVVDYFAVNGPGPYRAILVDNYLLPKTLPPWIKLADFSLQMYTDLAAAICRPGLGTVSDLICVNAFIFSIYEQGNLEMSYNAKVIKESGLGCDFYSVQQVLSFML